MIVRIKRGSHVLAQLVGEATRQHRTVSVMGVRPAFAAAEPGPDGIAFRQDGSSERASTRCAQLDSCVNSVVEGFLV
jgi:hypothetical protein